jgi:hypothetical protein
MHQVHQGGARWNTEVKAKLSKMFQPVPKIQTMIPRRDNQSVMCIKKERTNENVNYPEV